LGQLLKSLPLEQRLLRYRQFAKDALNRASREPDRDLKGRYLSMAAGWHILAEEIEKANDRITTMEAYYKAREAPRSKDH
jgi:hypothetical protein